LNRSRLRYPEFGGGGGWVDGPAAECHMVSFSTERTATPGWCLTAAIGSSGRAGTVNRGPKPYASEQERQRRRAWSCDTSPRRRVHFSCRNARLGGRDYGVGAGDSRRTRPGRGKWACSIHAAVQEAPRSKSPQFGHKGVGMRHRGRPRSC